MKSRLLFASGTATLALASHASAAPEPAPTNLTITPSITCPEGATSEMIRLSRAAGDAIDGVFAFCRDPALTSAAWIAQLESTRDKLIAGTADEAGKESIRRAFAAHIARERAAH